MQLAGQTRTNDLRSYGIKILTLNDSLGIDVFA